MTDRKLLEAAAKAAGLMFDSTVKHKSGLLVVRDDAACQSEQVLWNPLTDDGDAFRLAVKLDMCFGIAPHRVALDKVSIALAPGSEEVQEKHNDDPLAATRRAIVRAAAEIGRSMK